MQSCDKISILYASILQYVVLMLMDMVGQNATLSKQN